MKLNLNTNEAEGSPEEILKLKQLMGDQTKSTTPLTETGNPRQIKSQGVYVNPKATAAKLVEAVLKANKVFTLTGAYVAAYGYEGGRSKVFNNAVKAIIMQDPRVNTKLGKVKLLIAPNNVNIDKKKFKSPKQYQGRQRLYHTTTEHKEHMSQLMLKVNRIANDLMQKDKYLNVRRARSMAFELVKDKQKLPEAHPLKFPEFKTIPLAKQDTLIELAKDTIKYSGLINFQRHGWYLGLNQNEWADFKAEFMTHAQAIADFNKVENLFKLKNEGLTYGQ